MKLTKLFKQIFSPTKKTSENIKNKMATNQDLIDRLINKTEFSPKEIEKRYPPRSLKESAKVTRVAPSPTGFMHIGGIFAGLLSERLAHQSGGVFYVRIEDTDKKREVEGAAQLIIDSFKMFDISVDEGESEDGNDIGNYGPYRQSKRIEIYKTFIKKLLAEGKAYPCFCSAEELEEISAEQNEKKIRPGYYGQWAVWRDKSEDEVSKALDEGKPFVIRFRSQGSHEKRIIFFDQVKGELSLPENDQDVVIMKSDGLPTYHFAHVIDDHFMRTTLALRGEEWLSSTPLHLEMFKALDFEVPQYGHFPAINKLEGTSKRKLSKRKDPEANITFYEQEGYPGVAVIEYLLNLIDSSFEDWQKINPKKDYKEFPISLEHLKGSAGPLLDMVKLNDISKNYIGDLSAEEVYDRYLAWANKYDSEFAKKIEVDPEYAKSIFAIERGLENSRKDLSKWSEVRSQIDFFYDDIFDSQEIDYSKNLPNTDASERQKIINAFLSTYNKEDDKDQWFEKIKTIATDLGYAENVKDYKQNKENYKGHVGDVAMVLRVALTGRRQTPDLYCMIKVMGQKRVEKRLK